MKRKIAKAIVGFFISSLCGAFLWMMYNLFRESPEQFVWIISITLFIVLVGWAFAVLENDR